MHRLLIVALVEVYFHIVIKVIVNNLLVSNYTEVKLTISNKYDNGKGTHEVISAVTNVVCGIEEEFVGPEGTYSPRFGIPRKNSGGSSSSSTPSYDGIIQYVIFTTTIHVE